MRTPRSVLNRLGLTKFPFRDEQFGVLPSQKVARPPKPVINRSARTCDQSNGLAICGARLESSNYKSELWPPRLVMPLLYQNCVKTRSVDSTWVVFEQKADSPSSCKY